MSMPLLSTFTSYSFLLLLIYCSSTITGIYLSVVSDVNAFVLFSPQHGTNHSRTSIFLQDGCPPGSSYIVGTESGRRHVLPLDSIRRLECAVMIRTASNIISLDRPFVDLVAVADVGILSHVRHPLCITAQLALSTSATVPISCTVSPFDSARQSCLLRIIVPYSWFPLNSGHKQAVTLLHSIDKECGAPNAKLQRIKITLLPPVPNCKSLDLDKQYPVVHLQIMSPTNFTFSTNSLTTLLLHFDYNDSDAMRLTTIQIRAWLNNRLKLLSVTSADPKMWTIQVEAAAYPDAHTTFICQYSSDDSNLQRFNGYIMMVLIKVKGSGAKSEMQLKNEDGDLVNVHWAVQYVFAGNSTYIGKTATKRVTTQFRIVSDIVYSLLPIIKSENLINTAVLSGKQAAVPMRIFSITEGGNLNDVTSNSHCLSAESRVLKTSPTCSSIYVDGSELRGMGKVKVHAHFGTLTTSVEITVWYPRLPITVWISDPVLNAVQEFSTVNTLDWHIAVWKWLSSNRRRKREARQFGCVNKYQQAEVRILASYYVGDKETGERIYLSGDRDTLFDVTSLAVNHVHSSNIGVAAVLPRHERIFVIANRPGSARITVRSNTPNVDYGSAPVVVTEDVVSVRRLEVEGVVDIALDIEPTPRKPQEYVVSAFIQNTLTHRYQHATVVCRVYFSDEQMLELIDIPSDQYVLHAWSSDEQAVAVNHGPAQDIELTVLQNVKNVLLSVSLHSPAQCSEADSIAIVQIDYPIQIEFSDRKLISTPPVAAISYNSTMGSELTAETGGWHSEVLLGLIILLAAVIGIVHAIGSRARRPFNEGYEKLVLPILTRLSSSSSCGKDENSQEWIWLSKAQIDSASINSRYSQKSTADVAENSSNLSIGSTQRSVSYRGSEISVFISPQPAVAINLDSLGRHTTSWRGRPKTKLSRNAMIDSSSSEHNLSRYSYASSNGYSYPPPASSGKKKGSWCHGGGGTEAIPAQQCWRQINHDFSHDSIPDIDGVRETVT